MSKACLQHEQALALNHVAIQPVAPAAPAEATVPPALASAAAAVLPSFRSKPSKSLLLPAVRQRLLQQRRAEDAPKCQELSRVRQQLGPASYLALEPRSLAIRRAAFRMNRVRTGRLLFLRSLSPSQACGLCGSSVDNVWHVLMECPAHGRARRATQAALAKLRRDLLPQTPRVRFGIGFLLGELPDGLSVEMITSLLSVSQTFLSVIINRRPLLLNR
jgi:hypothetical protein